MKINFFILSTKLIYIFILIDSYLNECNDRSKPILLLPNNICVMKYCTEKDFEDKTCIKSNNIIKTQWLNNIIKFGEENSRFSKIVKYSNNDLIAFSALYPGSKSRYFYGLKENGRPLFIENNKETPYLSLDLEIDNAFFDMNFLAYYEGEILAVKIGDEEYIINIGNGFKFTELYDFKNKKVFKKQNSFIFSPIILSNIRGPLFNLKDSKSFLYGGFFKSYIPQSNPNLYLYKLFLNSKDSFEIDNIKELTIQTGSTAYGNMVSCYETYEPKIVCFYILSPPENKYNIISISKDYSTKINLFIISNVIDENIFFKCIHYEKEDGIFIYY